MADNEYDFFAQGDGTNGSSGAFNEYDGDDGARRRRPHADHPVPGQTPTRPAPSPTGQAPTSAPTGQDVIPTGQAASQAPDPAAQSRRSSGRTTTYRAGFAFEPARRSRIAAIVALLAGLVAIAFGAASAAHESAPAIVDPDGKVPGRYIALTCAIFIAVSFVAVIVAKTNLPRNSRRHRVGSGGIVTLLIAGLLLAFGVVCGVLFPDGLFKPNVRDEAPISSAEGMRYDVERATGACEAGWTDIDVHAYPGVETASLCASTRVAYATFDSNTTLRLYDNVVQSKLSELLTQNADDPNAQGDWRLLSGNQWMAFGPADKMTTLEQDWGGTLTAVAGSGEPASDAGDAAQ
ncbi:hypothetical protein COO72_07480 [Bifidobacterium callitrichos]|nr:hypothetical protein COO72_07480 [Bifidobacterium callitrichos]